jgi:prolyl oligopeptidase
VDVATRPPVARVQLVRETRFGVTLDDPYRWMEDPGDPDVDRWLDGQAAYSRSVLAALPHRRSLLERIGSLSGDREILSEFTLAGDRVFHLHRGIGAAVSALVVRDGDTSRVLLDPSATAGQERSVIDWYVPSPDGRYVACAIAQGGSTDATVCVVDVDRAALLGDAVKVGDGFFSWLPDCRTFAYHRYREAAADVSIDRLRDDSRSCLHLLGDDPERDVAILGRGLNPLVTIAARDRPYLVVPPGDDWVIALITHSATGERIPEQLPDNTLYVAPRAALSDPAGCVWTRVAGPDDAVTALAASADTLYLACHRDAPRGQVLAVPFADPNLSRARLLVPGSDRAIDAVAVVGEHLLVRDLDGGIGRLRRVPLTGGQPADVALPVEGSIDEWAAHPYRPHVLLVLTSWTQSPRAYRLDLPAATLTDLDWIPPAPVDVADIYAEEIQVPARDGTPIPLSVIHRRGLVLNGNNPTMMGAAGSYGFTLRPWFWPEMLAWYERGGVLAIAHVRGGGEYGREWHTAGRGPNKETTITDFIDCAEYLIAHGYTRPGRLAGNGGSAGAIPVGGALVRRPDLWAAVVLRVPVTNSTRIEFSEYGPINVPEFGSITTEAGLRDLLITDSYLRITDGTDYPAVLLTTGRNDHVVPMWQAGKMAARLQAASTSQRPILLRIEEHTGHTGGSTREQQDTLLADQLAFLLHAFAG